ncbi:MAG: hypothetical protein ABL879_14115 [Devosia sp.]
MDYLLPFLFWVHLLSLAVGGAAVFGIPLIGAKVPTTAAEMRPVLFGIITQLSSLGRAAFALLLVSGLLMFWFKYGWVSPGPWFAVKMVLVALMLGNIIYSGINAKRAQSGDMAATKRGPQLSVLGVALFLLVIATAVLAFD